MVGMWFRVHLNRNENTNSMEEKNLVPGPKFPYLGILGPNVDIS